MNQTSREGGNEASTTMSDGHKYHMLSCPQFSRGAKEEE